MHFIVADSSVHTLQPFVDASLPLSDKQKRTIAFPWRWWKPAVEQSSPRRAHSLQMDGNQTAIAGCQSDLELQHDQASAVFPNLPRTYSNIPLIP
jgi:hypothetical protein